MKKLIFILLCMVQLIYPAYEVMSDLEEPWQQEEHNALFDFDSTLFDVLTIKFTQGKPLYRLRELWRDNFDYVNSLDRFNDNALSFVSVPGLEWLGAVEQRHIRLLEKLIQKNTVAEFNAFIDQTPFADVMMIYLLSDYLSLKNHPVIDNRLKRLQDKAKEKIRISSHNDFLRCNTTALRFFLQFHDNFILPSFFLVNNFDQEVEMALVSPDEKYLLLFFRNGFFQVSEVQTGRIFYRDTFHEPIIHFSKNNKFMTISAMKPNGPFGVLLSLEQEAIYHPEVLQNAYGFSFSYDDQFVAISYFDRPQLCKLYRLDTMQEVNIDEIHHMRESFYSIKFHPYAPCAQFSYYQFKPYTFRQKSLVYYSSYENVADGIRLLRTLALPESALRFFIKNGVALSDWFNDSIKVIFNNFREVIFQRNIVPQLLKHIGWKEAFFGNYLLLKNRDTKHYAIYCLNTETQDFDLIKIINKAGEEINILDTARIVLSPDNKYAAIIKEKELIVFALEGNTWRIIIDPDMYKSDVAKVQFNTDGNGEILLLLDDGTLELYSVIPFVKYLTVRDVKYCYTSNNFVMFQLKNNKFIFLGYPESILYDFSQSKVFDENELKIIFFLQTAQDETMLTEEEIAYFKNLPKRFRKAFTRKNNAGLLTLYQRLEAEEAAAQALAAVDVNPGAVGINTDEDRGFTPAAS